MKEATGEASLSVITIVLIAAIAAVAFYVVNMMMEKTRENAEEITNGMVISSVISLDD